MILKNVCEPVVLVYVYVAVLPAQSSGSWYDRAHTGNDKGGAQLGPVCVPGPEMRQVPIRHH
jgi:hypothetical protein